MTNSHREHPRSSHLLFREALPCYLSPHRWTSKASAWAGSSYSWVFLLLPCCIDSGAEMSLPTYCLFCLLFHAASWGWNYSLSLTFRWSSTPGSAQTCLALESRQNPACSPQCNSHKLNPMALCLPKLFFRGWCNFSVWSAIFDVCWGQVQLGWRAYVAPLKSNLFWGEI